MLKRQHVIVEGARLIFGVEVDEQHRQKDDDAHSIERRPGEDGIFVLVEGFGAFLFLPDFIGISLKMRHRQIQPEGDPGHEQHNRDGALNGQLESEHHRQKHPEAHARAQTGCEGHLHPEGLAQTPPVE
jgi:hypothetical protein